MSVDFDKKADDAASRDADVGASLHMQVASHMRRSARA
jgi:hypothetical protein